jgi:hypothetical protein
MVYLSIRLAACETARLLRFANAAVRLRVPCESPSYERWAPQTPTPFFTLEMRSAATGACAPGARTWGRPGRGPTAKHTKPATLLHRTLTNPTAAATLDESCQTLP